MPEESAPEEKAPSEALSITLSHRRLIQAYYIHSVESLVMNHGKDFRDSRHCLFTACSNWSVLMTPALINYPIG